MMVSIILMIVIGLVMLVIGILVGYILRKSIGEKTIGNAEQKAKNMILDAENRAETVKKELVLEVSSLLAAMKNAMEEIRKDLEKAGTMSNMKERAHFCYDEMVPAMNRLREPADRLEMIVDKEYWPFPSYGDMIFEV